MAIDFVTAVQASEEKNILEFFHIFQMLFCFQMMHDGEMHNL